MQRVMVKWIITPHLTTMKSVTNIIEVLFVVSDAQGGDSGTLPGLYLFSTALPEPVYQKSRP